MCEEFLKYANKLRNQYLFKTESLFLESLDEWLFSLKEHFILICEKIGTLQEVSALPPISYLEYTMLYTNFINRRYVAEIWVYGEQRYLDIDQRMIEEYDISAMFIFFEEMWNDLLKARKLYVGQVSSSDITAFMLGTIHDFYSYLRKLVRIVLMHQADDHLFRNIAKNAYFRVNVGDYMARTQPVFMKNDVKDAKELADWFQERSEEQYYYGDYSSLDFSGQSIIDIDLRCSSFRASKLNGVVLKDSLLISSDFGKAQMEDANLTRCKIFEANFAGAYLKNACFINASAFIGLISEKEWIQAGFLPVCFQNADLSGADFTDAFLPGADFTGAILTNTCFDGAILDSAVFSRDDLWLSPEQKNAIKLKEGR